VTPDRKSPVYLNLLQIRLPVGGVLSILHRVSGVLLTLSIPFMIWLMQHMNSGPDGYAYVIGLMNHGAFKLLVFLLAWLMIQHSLSGIRHLLLDMGVGYELARARSSAWLAFALSILLAAVLAVVLW
jgi:succinate dehydrogenase / fumarate reductase cytochrome b subunit